LRISIHCSADGIRQAEALCPVQVVDNRPCLLSECGEQDRQQLVPEGILQATEAADEGIHTLRQIGRLVQLRDPRRSEGAGEEPPGGQGEMAGLLLGDAHKKSQALMGGRG
jgi:hypothetical protein